jgi:Flp pilus assembly pilin Flp
MSRLQGLVLSFIRSDDGLAVTEYGLLLALVAVALVVVVKAFGTTISTWFSNSYGTITAAQ